MSVSVNYVAVVGNLDKLLRACLPQSRENTWLECGGDHRSVFLAMQFLRAGNF